MDLGDAISELETFVWLLRNQTQIEDTLLKISRSRIRLNLYYI